MDGKYQTIKEIDSVLGLNLLIKKELSIPKEVQNLVKERGIARQSKDWKKSDELRDKIIKLGFSVLDGKDGSQLEKI